jgi:mono/diheme cytochrome c family protein/glucose/arabinose dehydrogenase
MSSARLIPFAVLASTALASGVGLQSSQANRPWPPAVQKVSDESPALSAEDELKTFYMPPGYRVELVASEPLIQEPVALDWDLQGRLWAVEMPGFMQDITGSTENDPIGRVVVLEDTDHDGRMDKRTVFADGLVLGRSLKILDRGVLVAEPPNVWLMRDTDGDLKADTKELVTNRYGRRGIDPQENANGFAWGLDNIMHTAGQSDIELRLKNGSFEILNTLDRGEWGVTEDDAGRDYRNTNESALHVDLVPTRYFARNPNLLRTRGSYERLADENPDLNTVWPVRPNPGTNRAYQVGIDRPDGTLAKFTSVCAPMVYRGDRLPSELYGNVFVVEPAANVVSRIVVDDSGGGVQARKAYDRGEFLASTDERFRPVYISNAPDGLLYIADLYHGIIEHRISITEYLRDQILSRHLDKPTGLGRIFRVVHDPKPPSGSEPTPPLGGASGPQLVGVLTHPNGWWRDTAQRLLIERHDVSAVPALTKLASSDDWKARLRALWTLDGLDAIEPALVTRALEDGSPDVRAAALRLSERWLAHGDEAFIVATGKHIDDPDVRVRRQLAASLGVLPEDARQRAIVPLLERHADDPVTMDAALSGLHGMETAVLEQLLNATAQTPQQEAAITMLTATIVRAGDAAAAARVLDWIGQTTRASWQRSALLHGAEVALLEAPMPGSAARRSVQRAANLPCPTCQGGRAGPGGAYAFQRPGDPTVDNGRRNRSGRTLHLSAEPTALEHAAEASDDLGRRATAVLARVTWPGKPGAEAAVAPLTPVEQQRFEAGREIYRNICQACHQADGRGQDKIAPPLVGSELALAAPGVPVRILLNGKEGAIGLMPPIGTTLSDDQIASVLTYVRRNWDQTGSPVDPEVVKDTRALTASRSRPWTDEELRTLARTMK